MIVTVPSRENVKTSWAEGRVSSKALMERQPAQPRAVLPPKKLIPIRIPQYLPKERGRPSEGWRVDREGKRNHRGQGKAARCGVATVGGSVGNGSAGVAVDPSPPWLGAGGKSVNPESD